MRKLTQRFRPVMRKAFILAVIAAIVAAPVVLGHVGFCRSMPCCAPHAAAHMADAHHPDCCNTTNCSQTPAAAREYTSAKHVDAPQFVAVSVIPVVQTLAASCEGTPHTPSASPPPLQRRIALLSILVI